LELHQNWRIHSDATDSAFDWLYKRLNVSWSYRLLYAALPEEWVLLRDGGGRAFRIGAIRIAALEVKFVFRVAPVA
jgi:hypothetical protein